MDRRKSHRRSLSEGHIAEAIKNAQLHRLRTQTNSASVTAPSSPLGGPLDHDDVKGGGAIFPPSRPSRPITSSTSSAAQSAKALPPHEPPALLSPSLPRAVVAAHPAATMRLEPAIVASMSTGAPGAPLHPPPLPLQTLNGAFVQKARPPAPQQQQQQQELQLQHVHTASPTHAAHPPSFFDVLSPDEGDGDGRTDQGLGAAAAGSATSPREVSEHSPPTDSGEIHLPPLHPGRARGETADLSGASAAESCPAAPAEGEIQLSAHFSPPTPPPIDPSPEVVGGLACPPSCQQEGCCVKTRS